MGCVDCGGDNNWDNCDALEIEKGPNSCDLPSNAGNHSLGISSVYAEASRRSLGAKNWLFQFSAANVAVLSPTIAISMFIPIAYIHADNYRDADGISGEIKHLMNHPSCDTVHSNSFAAS